MYVHVLVFHPQDVKLEATDESRATNKLRSRTNSAQADPPLRQPFVHFQPLAPPFQTHLGTPAPPFPRGAISTHSNMASFSSTSSFLTLAQAKLWQDSARRLRALGRLSAWPQRGDPSWSVPSWPLAHCPHCPQQGAYRKQMIVIWQTRS